MVCLRVLREEGGNAYFRRRCRDPTNRARGSSNDKTPKRKPIMPVRAVVLILISAAQLAAQDVAITNVNVIPMDRERILADHVVLIRNGLVRAVGPRGT